MRHWWVILLLFLTSCGALQHGTRTGAIIQIHYLEVTYLDGTVDTLYHRGGQGLVFGEHIERFDNGSYRKYLKTFNPNVPGKKADFVAFDIINFRKL